MRKFAELHGHCFPCLSYFCVLGFTHLRSAEGWQRSVPRGSHGVTGSAHIILSTSLFFRIQIHPPEGRQLSCSGGEGDVCAVSFYRVWIIWIWVLLSATPLHLSKAVTRIPESRSRGRWLCRAHALPTISIWDPSQSGKILSGGPCSHEHVLPTSQTGILGSVSSPNLLLWLLPGFDTCNFLPFPPLGPFANNT